MDQAVRNRLRNVVTQCRRLLEDATSQALQGRFGIYAAGRKDEVHVEDDARMGHLTDEDRALRRDLLDHLEHIKAVGLKPREALERLVREIAFTHLNRLCAYKMMEARVLIREAVSRGLKSQGFFFYLADHPEDEKLHKTGQQDAAYRNFLDWLGGTLSEEIGVLFNPNDPANRLYPPQRVLDEVLGLVNGDDLAGIWTEDETIGWVYQYFTPKELRDKARKESQAPRNSYELAFRNQFYTPRYVVEFLTDNTLVRTWYEMRKGKTALKDRCRYLIRRPTEVFLAEGQEPPDEAKQTRDDLSQEELLKQPVYIPHRPKKDPREIRILDPACGSGHFLLYCFDLLQVIYEEAYDDPDLGAALRKDYPAIVDLRQAVPGLILKHNLHGIDIDLRATQIAALALWLRCQRAYQELGLKNGERPKIARSNIVCAEPMPGEADMLEQFLTSLRNDRLESLIRRVLEVPENQTVRATQRMADALCDLVRLVWREMQLAGEAGSLLKVEDALATAIADARKEWEAKLPLFRVMEFGLTEREQKVHYYRSIPGQDEDFWSHAEVLVLAALQDYAEHAQNGRAFRRKLFAEDAGQGFAFIDLCRKRYDVVLMNPPFGSASANGKAYLEATYPSSKADIYAMFVDRAIELSPPGMTGAITNRTGFFLDSLTHWRQRLLVGPQPLNLFADLGDRVLDALVEAAAYTTHQASSPAPAVFLRLLSSEDKRPDLNAAIAGFNTGKLSLGIYEKRTDGFTDFPAYRVSYWAPQCMQQWFRNMPAVNRSGIAVQFGLSTKDDFRFLRLAWEVRPATIVCSRTDAHLGQPWMFFAKGGEYAPFWGDVHLLAHWANEGEHIAAHIVQKYPYLAGSVSWVLHPEVPYGKPGITYTRRTTSGFSPRILPRGCLISDTGPTFYTQDERHLPAIQALSMSRVFRTLLELCVASGDSIRAGSAARTYEIGIVAKMPIPSVSDLPNEVENQVRAIWDLARQLESSREASRYFDALASLSLPTHQSLVTAAARSQRLRLARIVQATETASGVDAKVQGAYGIDEPTRRLIEGEFGPTVCAYANGGPQDGEEIARLWRMSVSELQRNLAQRQGFARYVTKQTYWVDQKLELVCHILGLNPGAVLRLISDAALTHEVGPRLAIDLVSLSVGTVFGRWDIRFATGGREPPQLPAPFDPLPVCPPGMLQGPDGLPARPDDVPPDYSVRIDWDGILVDDPEHPDDIVRRVRQVLEVLWKDHAEAVEKEACGILGVRELRDYLRKPATGGFWMNHVRRYSKSRRKAPIYWYLRSAKGNYGLWLYYHRLDKDILFKALLNYVEPKIRLEEDRLSTLRARREGAGKSGREAKVLEKDIDRQEQFVAELQDFRDRLRRAADLRIAPDLNDGVVLNIAPLWELVPWKEAKNYWEALQEGKYDWSHIALQLWPDRVKELCKRDRSVAIAHGLEDLCEVPPPKPRRAAVAEGA